MLRRLPGLRGSVGPRPLHTCKLPDKTKDALFIGPNDLHMALFGTAPAKFDSAAFVKVLDEIAQAGKRAGKPVGLLLPNGSKAVWARRRWGSDMSLLAVGGDVKAIVGWFGEELRISKGKV
jgi:2-keto-3-deoxy-L-rhamnonate aldolase RhmA